jgi:hypothetical protein
MRFSMIKTRSIFSDKQIPSRRQKPLLRRERGIALVLALIMLLLLSILGFMVVDTTTSDLRISGNIRNANAAFFNGDGALSLATNPNTVSGMLLSGKTSLLNNTVATATGTMIWSLEQYPSSTNGACPSGSAFDADVGSGGYRCLNLVATGEGTSAKNSDALLEAGIMQPVPNAI